MTFTTILKDKELSQVIELPKEYVNAEVEVKVRIRSYAVGFQVFDFT